MTNMLENVKELIFNDGTRVLHPNFNYYDDIGIHLDGGWIISADGTKQGHLDPPGRRVEGTEGVNYRPYLPLEEIADDFDDLEELITDL